MRSPSDEDGTPPELRSGNEAHFTVLKQSTIFPIYGEVNA